ncbi:MAG: DUF3179 domain-containing protein [Patescibacteria group bacterium]|jgi:hypothetical protein
MKKSSIQVLTFVGVFVLTLGVLYGVKFWQDKKIDGVDANLGDGIYTTAVSYRGEAYLIPPEDIYDYGQSAEDLPALTDPLFVSVDEADAYLAEEVSGIDVEVGGVHRFYSYQILNWHEVVNDTFGDEKFLVTLCPLCRSAVVYDRSVDGIDLTFNSDGRVYNNNVLLRDAETDSLWLQLRGLAVSGEKIGTQLSIYPSVTMTWAEWKEAYPNGEVLSNETGYVRDYARHPYANYDTAETIYFPLNHEDNIVAKKWLLTGYVNERETIAFVNTIMKGFVVSNETVGGKPIVAFSNADGNQIHVFDASVNGETLTFAYDFETKKITDTKTNSVWSLEGLATSGSLRGTQLVLLPTQEAFWMCWVSQYPKTLVSHMERVDETLSAEDSIEGETLTVPLDGSAE